MHDLKNMNVNVITNHWKQRLAEQPDEIKKKIQWLENAPVREYQLQVIKKKRIYPQIGDVFEMKPPKGTSVYGLVINNHINNINGKDLLLILIFKDKWDIDEFCGGKFKKERLLLSPQIVGEEYWTKGYFFNVAHMQNVGVLNNYGFYSIGKGKYYDEYGTELFSEPQLIGVYGVGARI